uniref:Uncharacterized protein n=1 Tax=Anopheles culicifacies TaxID=139723 RepID=A0A182LS04_9DIPT
MEDVRLGNPYLHDSHTVLEAETDPSIHHRESAGGKILEYNPITVFIAARRQTLWVRQIVRGYPLQDGNDTCIGGDLVLERSIAPEQHTPVWICNLTLKYQRNLKH